MFLHFKLKILLEYIAVLLVILTSGTYLWYHKLSPAISCSIFLVFAIFFRVYHSKGCLIKSCFIYLIITYFIALVSFLIHPQIADNQLAGFVFLSLGSYLILSNIEYQSFKRKYLKIVALMCIYSIPIYLLIESEYSPFTVINNGEYLSCLGVTIGWYTGPFHRFSAIFHEPGACQIVLNIALILYIENIQKWYLTKQEKIELSIVVIGLFLTKSTGGYLVFVIILLCCIEKKIRSKYFFPMVIVAVVSCYLIVNSDVVQNKINGDEEHVSLIHRQADNLAMLQMIEENPLWGYGLGSMDHLNRSDALGNWSNSNGVLYMASSLGIPWLFIYLLFLIIGIKKIGYKNVLVVLILIAYLLLEFNEKFVEFPISYILLFMCSKTR